MNKQISRREFLKIGVMGAGMLLFQPSLQWKQLLSEWPEAEKLGRNCVGGVLNIRAKPSANSASVGVLYEDAVFPWLREVVGEAPAGLLSRRWVETPQGYIYAPSVQPVYYRPNQPVDSLPETSTGKGMWAEVTVPYVDIYPVVPPCSNWLANIQNPRLYYSQVMWVEDILTNSHGQVLYRVNEKYGNCGDVVVALAEAFRPITPEEIAPIHPEAENKKIVVDLNYQTLSCYEGKEEVYFCRISSGARFDAAGNPVEKWSTPPGAHLPWRKSISIHMAGGQTESGWDTPGVPWTILFDPDGAAIHSTFWHNDFGNARSHGCVNASPEDAKWIFRWSSPHVPYDPGDMDLTGIGGTVVEVVPV